jgi:hypothetical protein
MDNHDRPGAAFEHGSNTRVKPSATRASSHWWFIGIALCIPGKEQPHGLGKTSCGAAPCGGAFARGSAAIPPPATSATSSATAWITVAGGNCIMVQR